MYFDGDRVVLSPSDLKTASECEFAFLRALDVRLGRAEALDSAVDPMYLRTSTLGDEHELRTLERYRERFGSGVVEVERPIRVQGIYTRELEVGSNVWVGYGACFLRGVRVGDNSIVGTNSVVTKDVPANAVVGGVPAKLIRMRETPQELRWPHPVEPPGA